MNLAHLHLILNHLPVLTLPTALVFFISAIVRKDEPLRRFSLLILVATAAMVLPAYLTGEPAEKMIEHLPGVSEQLIEAHEEAAEASLVLTLLAGAASGVALIFSNRNPFLRKIAPAVIVLLCLVATGSLAYTASLGGKIRHPEILNSPAQANTQEKGHHDD